MLCRRLSPAMQLLCLIVLLVWTTKVGFAEPKIDSAQQTANTRVKFEAFDRDPGWLGVNNRSARIQKPAQIRQAFGFSGKTHHAGGVSPGEIGGFITPAGECAYYAKTIDPVTFDNRLHASGQLSMGQGGTNLLLGFFNSRTVNEWRTPNTIAIRLNSRGDKFFAYVEYCTAKWRAGGDSTPFPSTTDPKTGRSTLIGFPCDQSLHWSLTYDPNGNNGGGLVTATIGEAMAACNLDKTHKTDGAAFDHFGVMNVVKSADSGSTAWFDDIAVNGESVETFTQDPSWSGRDNHKTYSSQIVRPRFDFGFTDTNFAGGKHQGELGGQIFRGDCRYPERMACYGDRVGPLTLDKPFRASGKIAMTRGVSDSTTLFGFYNSQDSMRSNASQSDGLPESVVGIHVEGPSRDGFRFYPVARLKGGNSRFGRVETFPIILPNGSTHDWSMVYNPAGASGHGQITVMLDGKSGTFDFEPGAKDRHTTFDRFGIVTSWIDGNSQNVYWDDVSYTVDQE